MGGGVDAFLPDEPDHVLVQLAVMDHRKDLAEDLHEPAFGFRQEEVEHVDVVRGERLAGNPLKGQVRPVEPHLSGVERAHQCVDDSVPDGVVVGEAVHKHDSLSRTIAVLVHGESNAVACDRKRDLLAGPVRLARVHVSSRLRIFPVAVIGRASTNSTTRGYL